MKNITAALRNHRKASERERELARARRNAPSASQRDELDHLTHYSDLR